MNKLVVEFLPQLSVMTLKRWGVLRKNNRLEVTERSRQFNSGTKQRERLQSNLDKLLDGLYAGDMDKIEYERHKHIYQTEIEKIDSLLSKSKERAEDWMTVSEKAFDFAVNARHNFANGDIRTKRDVLRTLGKNLVLTDNRLEIEPNEWLVPIGENYAELERGYFKVRTNKKASSKELEEALMSIYSNWRARRDSNPRHSA